MQLSSIQKFTIMDSQTVTSTIETSKFDLDKFYDGFAAQIDWVNGVGPVDITVKIQVSINGTTFSDLPSSEFNITTLSGNNIWDIVGTNVAFIKFVLTVTTGEADFSILISGKRFH